MSDKENLAMEKSVGGKLEGGGICLAPFCVFFPIGQSMPNRQ